ncbi:MAG: LuxR C-terminal-related transcriptional regulator [bacterium]
MSYEHFQGNMLKNLLSKQDTICLLELIEESLSCNNEEDLKKLIQKLNLILPYDHAISLLCTLKKNTTIDLWIPSSKLINISYPEEWLKIYLERKYYKVDPIFKENFLNYRLQYWIETYKRNPPPKDFLYTAESFNLGEGYTYGLRDFSSHKGSLFSIGGKSVEHNERTEIILCQIIPHFHHALTRVISLGKKREIHLSPREKEVINWIKEGKTSWEISMILEISERTVIFHLQNIMQKLDAVNRAQCVAIALEQGLIDID